MKKYSNSLIIKIFVLIISTSIFFACSSNSTSPAKSSAKQILSFVFNDFTTPVVGIIDQNAKTINLKVPFGTNLTNLVPTITISDKAILSPATDVAQNFTNAVIYTVTAEDGSTASYTVTVTYDTSNPVTLSGKMSTNTTLKDLGLPIDYIIDGAFYVDGNALLTIEPGTTIAFTSVDSYFQVNENAGISAVGTTDKPIIFIGPVNNPNKGSWDGIYIESNRADNKFSYVNIINGGSTTSGAALNIQSGAKLAMSNCKISGSLNDGLYLESNAVLSQFDNNTIEICDAYPISCDNLTQTANFNITDTLSNNTQPSVEVRSRSTFSKNFTLNKIGIPYDVNQIYVTGGTLTISDGVTLRFQNSGYLTVKDGGMLNATGTTFTSTTPIAGFWYSIEINNQYNNILQNCIIEYCGMDDEGGIYTPDGKVSLTNVAIMHSSSYGIVFSSKNNLIIHSGVTFSDCAKGNVFDYSKNEILNDLP